VNNENDSINKELPRLASKPRNSLYGSKNVRISMGLYMNDEEFEEYLKKGHKLELP